jgi:uncharacterized delta-60 repeat protein
MSTNYLLSQRLGALLVLCLLGRGPALAQGPTIDPAFQPTTVYKPASVRQVLQQPDGKRLVLSSSLRAGHQPAGPVARLLANSNEPDSVFTSHARGVRGTVRFMALLPSGKVLLAGYDTLTLGPVTRRQLLLLNADGTPDAGFNADALVRAGGFGSVPLTNLVGQPDGKVLVVCNNPSLLGASRLVRLLPDGTLDTAFEAALYGSMRVISQVGNNVVVQPDGKLVVPGNFNNYKGVVRLLPTGALDQSFDAQFTVSTTVRASQVAVQADGKVVVTSSSSGGSGAQPLVRLTDTGAVDFTFQSAVTGDFSTAFAPAPQVQVQPDGKLLVSGSLSGTGLAPGTLLARLLPDGRLDTGFDAATPAGPALLTDVLLLPGGQLLALRVSAVEQGLPVNRLVLLNPDGSANPGLEPRLYIPGYVNDVVRLPGGDYLVGGNFTELNGVSAKYVARLSPTGVPDPSFAVAADNEVRTLALQPDGKLLVGGAFEHIAGGNRVSIARLLPTGALDMGFAPAFFPTTFLFSGGIGRVGLLPDGRVVAAGGTRTTSTGPVKNWLRVLDATTGQRDLTWPEYRASDFLVQPGGKVVVAGFDTISTGSPFLGSCLFRLLPSGRLDPAFTPLTGTWTGLGGGPVVTALAQGPTGTLFATSRYYTDAGAPRPARLDAFQADGQPLATVTDNRFTDVQSLAVQPNGRLLVSNDMNNATAAYGLSRLLSSLAPDPSFGGANRPAPSTVRRLLVQADGAIMVAGSFLSVGGLPYNGLVRLLDTNVLSVPNQQLAARTQAWPVPAHGALHLALDAAGRPRCVELLDALGRVVLTQAVGQPELTLDTTPLPAGPYVLRVQYADGPVARRVVVE